MSIVEQLSEIERHLLRVSFDRALMDFSNSENSTLAGEAIDKYIADIRTACDEDQGTPDGKPGTVGNTVQNELRALKYRVSTLAVERDYGDTVVAIALNEDSSIHDHCFNWETAQSMALSGGYRIIAMADDGSMSRDAIQRLCDAERDRYNDCFGVNN